MVARRISVSKFRCKGSIDPKNDRQQVPSGGQTRYHRHSDDGKHDIEHDTHVPK